MENCIFCEIINGNKKSWKVYEDNTVYAFLDINPINEYHTLVIPKKHYKDIFETPKEELVALMSAVKQIVMLFRTKIGITDVQILNSSGEEAQQDVFHIHFHIIPREKGDNQDIKWHSHGELRTEFDQLIMELGR